MKILLRLLGMLKSPRVQALSILGASAIGTMVGLFGVQEWYRSYMSIQAAEMEAAPEVERPRVFAEQRAKLEKARLPIARAKKEIAAAGPSRSRITILTPAPSTDPAPASGWMHAPGFEAIPETPPAPPEPPIAVAAEATP